MFGIEQLKNQIFLTSQQVECPVKECPEYVERQTMRFVCEPQYQCPVHRIFISPTTFQYENCEENLLWKDQDDISLLRCISTVKRENRMGRDNSEDALTWNVFRYLEKSDLLDGLVSDILGISSSAAHIVYWSYSQKERGLLKILKQAREEFELVPSKGSEPDLIIITDQSFIIIEAKLTAGNKTRPGQDKVEGKYVSSGDNWWSEVFTSSFTDVAQAAKKYELARFWLLGTWMAKELDLNFYLINLVPAGRETDIESIFGSHIIQNQKNIFQRITWEDIIAFIKKTAEPLPDKNRVLNYLRNKTVGYDGRGRLKKAFLGDYAGG